MNYITNDKGESVIAVGAPGSIARVKAKYPALIYRVKKTGTWREGDLQRSGLQDFEFESFVHIIFEKGRE